MYTILAVAIGKPSRNCTIQTKNDPNLRAIRPYIRGAINWLEKQPNPPVPDSPLPKYKIGTDYKIEYRECDETDLPDTFAEVPNDLMLCLSTTVAGAAVQYTKDSNITTPIVAIVSDFYSFAQDNNSPQNICGVSAKRPDHVDKCLSDLQSDIPNAGKIYFLAKTDYGPSDASLAALGNTGQVVYVGATDDIQTQINTIPPGSGVLLVLPADIFFGAVDDIIQWAQVDLNLLTYWTVTDWVASSGSKGVYAGSGFPQELCGQYLAERIASIWSSKNHITIPDQPWKRVDDKWYDHKKNAGVAKALNITLGKAKSTKRRPRRSKK
jgi:hypothetical protein